MASHIYYIEDYHHICSPFSYVNMRSSCPLVLLCSTYSPPLGMESSTSFVLSAFFSAKVCQNPAQHSNSYSLPTSMLLPSFLPMKRILLTEEGWSSLSPTQLPSGLMAAKPVRMSPSKAFSLSAHGSPSVPMMVPVRRSPFSP